MASRPKMRGIWMRGKTIGAHQMIKPPCTYQVGKVCNRDPTAKKGNNGRNKFFHRRRQIWKVPYFTCMEQIFEHRRLQDYSNAEFVA